MPHLPPNPDTPAALPRTPRRRALQALGALGAAVSLPQAVGQFRLEITGVGLVQVPVSVAAFRDDALGSVSLSSIVRADLERSGQFRLIEPPPGAFDDTSRTNPADWRARNADAYLVGSVSRLADGRFDVRWRITDAVRGQDFGVQSVAVTADDLRLAAHRVADALVLRLTGERGVFSTRIAYVNKAGPRFSLLVADADGEGARPALAQSEPIISPSWSPSGNELAYVSFQSGKPVVQVHEVATGRRRVVADFRGSNSAPAWAPDGRSLAVVLSRDGGSQLFAVAPDGSNPRRLASSSAIDTEPCFSPDGRTLYFTSDRGGGPQIYRMPVSASGGGGDAQRVTFTGAYNISPALSPDGRWLAYIARNNGFKLSLMELASGTVRTLTDTTDDERPSFAPNSRLIVYATRVGGRDALMTTTLDGRVKARLAAPNADVREPAWGPFWG
jgi:TolB protein